MEWQTDTKRPIGCARSEGGAEMLPISLFEFAYFPRWLERLDDLQRIAQPESWACEGDTGGPNFNTWNPILERYINNIYTHAAMCYNEMDDSKGRDRLITIRDNFAAFCTNLYTPRYAPIIAYFTPNQMPGERRWYFRGWATPGNAMLARASPLPAHIPFVANTYDPTWPIRVNVEHIAHDEDNLDRLPPEVRNSKFLPLMLETAVEMARRKAAISPGIVVPQFYRRRIQYLLPISLADPEHVDLAMTLQPADGYYVASTMLTLPMAYGNARVIGRPAASWIYEPIGGRAEP